MIPIARQARAVVVLVALVAAGRALGAQPARAVATAVATSSPAAPFQDVVLTFGDLERIRAWYNAYDAILSASLAAGHWGALARDSAAQANVIATKNELRELLRSVGDRRADRNVVPPILIRLRALFTSVSTEIFPAGDTPAALNRMENSISGLLSTRLASRLDEYYRVFFIKYGKWSERLNWIEMYLTEAMFTPNPMGATVRLPSHWEWILREQVIGYQYDATIKSFRPSSPVSQLGLSYYLFGTNPVASLLNHVGVAGAYQHELGSGADLYGVVLHVSRIDVGFFCERRCVRPVWATSLNVQLIRRVF